MLRKTLEPTLEVPRHSNYVRFRNEAARLEPGEGYFYDVEAFEAALTKADKLWRAGKKNASRPQLTAAIDLYRGSLLAESPYEDFAVAAREQLRDLLLGAIGRLLELHACAKEWIPMVPLCRRGLAQDPYQERFYIHLMRAQMQLGNRREALQVYHEYEEMMIREMGLLPSAEMKSLADKITSLRK
jgi:DNA-binding SARP family transcriptional activator